MKAPPDSPRPQRGTGAKGEGQDGNLTEIRIGDQDDKEVPPRRPAHAPASRPARTSPKAAPSDSLADPPEIAEVISYGRAAAKLTRHPGTWKDKVLAIVSLAQKAREEAALPGWAQMEVWLNSKGFIETGKVTERPSPSPVITAARVLLAQGHRDCPTCRRPVLSRDDLRYMEERLVASMARYALAREVD